MSKDASGHNEGPLVELDFAENDEKPLDRLLEKERSVQENRKTARDYLFEASIISVDCLEGKQEKWATTAEPGTALTKLLLKDRVPYKVGDHIAVVPFGMQFGTHIEGICEALNIDPNAVFIARPGEGRTLEKHMSPLLFEIQYKYTTIKNVLTSVAALGDPLSATACAVLSGYAEDQQEFELLDRASNDADFLANMCKNGGMRWVDLFDSFKSLAGNIPLEIFLMLLPTHHARLYSIASSPKNAKNEIHIIVSRRVMGEAEQRRKGVASDDLSVMPPGSTLQFQVRTCRGFHLPADPRAPIVMVAAGSGLAPFRGFWQERMAAAQSGQPLGPAILLYGCREEPGSLLAKELIMAQACGAVSLVITAVSTRLPKRYIQDYVVENAAALKPILENPKCEVYMCGSTTMVKAVTAVLPPHKQGEAWIQKLQSEGRLHEDVFGGPESNC